MHPSRRAVSETAPILPKSFCRGEGNFVEKRQLTMQPGVSIIYSLINQESEDTEMTARCITIGNCSVSESVRSASMSFDAVRFYSYCVFYYYGWRSTAWQRT